MLSTKNSDPQRCAENLMRIVRGEVPFDRIRGVDAGLIDRPGSDAVGEVEEDAEWVLKTYEPRVEVESVTVAMDGESGDFSLSAKFK